MLQVVVKDENAKTTRESVLFFGSIVLFLLPLNSSVLLHKGLYVEY